MSPASSAQGVHIWPPSARSCALSLLVPQTSPKGFWSLGTRCRCSRSPEKPTYLAGSPARGAGRGLHEMCTFPCICPGSGGKRAPGTGTRSKASVSHMCICASFPQGAQAHSKANRFGVWAHNHSSSYSCLPELLLLIRQLQYSGEVCSQLVRNADPSTPEHRHCSRGAAASYMLR